ncbi:hypothetical protein MKZ38_003691 [Zalerion maritima]|uniref:Uncharacterized protein n=1 Tax=Zalerion maritima TaxID=339359 RepID=A0AAD5RMH5_9PEZI|nr:hypothetical protein MKZ38_003691 [Zalerion maritima]
MTSESTQVEEAPHASSQLPEVQEAGAPDTAAAAVAAAADKPGAPEKKATHSTRDQRIQVEILMRAGHNFARIMELTGLTYNQVRYVSNAVRNGDLEPRPRTGRPRMLSEEQVKQLVEFVNASEENKNMAYKRIPEAMGWDCTHHAIRHALRRAGMGKAVRQKQEQDQKQQQQQRLQQKGGITKQNPAPKKKMPSAAKARTAPPSQVPTQTAAAYPEPPMIGSPPYDQPEAPQL